VPVYQHRDRALAKFWLEPVALAESANFLGRFGAGHRIRLELI
jgi:hypothetical protein